VVDGDTILRVTRFFNKFDDRDKRKKLRSFIPESEVIIWSKLKGRQLSGKKFRRQYGIGRYVVDFYCAEARLVVEIDGDTHFNDEAEKYDRLRTQYIETLGLRVVRFNNNEVRRNLEGVLEIIKKELVLAKAAWDKRFGK